MKGVSMLIICAVRMSAGDLETFTDNALNYTQRNSACFALRGEKRPEVIAAMREALDNTSLQSCAGVNLRVAGAASELLDALERDRDSAARAIAARELGSLEKAEFLGPLKKAAEDRDLLVASNAIEGLVRFQDHSSAAALREIALLGGVVTSLALNALIDWRDQEIAAIGRKLMGHKDPGDQLAGIRAVGLAGDGSDLPRLREMEKDDTTMGAGNRGFGLMPAISIARAARTAIQNIETRSAR